jgi:hypothetical protein
MTEPHQQLLPIDVFGVRVLVAPKDTETLLRAVALAAVAVHDRPELLTRLDAVERERTRLRQLVLAADEACKTILSELAAREPL